MPDMPTQIDPTQGEYAHTIIAQMMNNFLSQSLSVQEHYRKMAESYALAAKQMWKLPESTTPTQLYSKASRVKSIYRDNDMAGQDAEISGYLENLPPSMALEYNTANFLSENLNPKLAPVLA